MASHEEAVHSPAAEGEPASKRARSADEDVAHNETDAAGSASTDMRQHWVDLDGCQTLQDVQKVLHTRFQTSQQLLDYIQTYRDKRLLKIIPLLMERPRHKLPHVNSLDHVCNLVSTCKNILVLTGAGVSVSAGIPDFRSSDGIYRRLRDEVRHLRPFATLNLSHPVVVLATPPLLRSVRVWIHFDSRIAHLLLHSRACVVDTLSHTCS